MSRQRQLASTTRPMQFLLVQATDHITGATGLTPTVTISKNGASFGSPSGAVTEVGSGWYALAGHATDRNTLGEFLIHVAATASNDPSDEQYEITAFDPFALAGAIRSATAQGGTTAFITLDASASATNNFYNGSLVTITSGTGAGQTRTIVSYNGNTKNANVDRNWTTAPDNTSVFAVLATDNPALNANLQPTANVQQTIIRSGTAQTGSTSNTIKLDSGASATNNIYVGDTVTITGGTGVGQTRTIVSYNGTTKVATVDRVWIATPDNTSTFNILANITPTTFSDQGVAQAGASGSITLASTASSVNSVYVGSLVTILSGTDAGDTSEITAYNGSTKVATVSPNFAVAPDTTSAYAVIPTQSGTGVSPGTQDVNVISMGSTPIQISTNGYPILSVGGYQSGQDPATLWIASALASCIGLPTTNGQALTYMVQQRDNKEHADKNTGIVTLYENDGTTVKSTQTYSSTSTTADRSAMS